MTDTAPPGSALVALVPEADAIIGRWRESLDPSARLGMPAHVSVLYPWLPEPALGRGELGSLAELVAAVPAFEVEFTELGRFPRTLWIAPLPADPFVRLTLSIERRWPDHPPYGGAFPSTVPHLSIGDAVDPDELGHVVADVAPQLPFTSRIDELTLFVRDGDSRWVPHSAYPLAR